MKRILVIPSLLLFLVLASMVSAQEQWHDVIVLMHDTPQTVSVQSTQSMTQSMDEAYPGIKMQRTFDAINGFGAKVTDSDKQRLENDPRVKALSPNRPMYAFLATTPQLMNATPVNRLIYQEKNITGFGQTVCVIDTGVDYTHEHMGNCASTSNLNDKSCAKVIGGYDFVNDDENPTDDNGHGTHVAGIVASTDPTYRGMAPNANIVALKALNAAGGGTTADVISAINWCTANASVLNITTIVMSLGTATLFTSACDGLDPATGAAVDAAVAANITVFAASGNDGSTTGIASPGCLARSTSVGSVTKSNSVSSFSNRNGITDLFGIGSSITSLRATGTTLASCSVVDATRITCSGTSMATPATAGIGVLVQQFYNSVFGHTLTPVQLQQTLNDSGSFVEDTGGSGFDFQRANGFSTLFDLENTTPQLSLSNENNSIVTNLTASIALTSSEILNSIILEVNGSNQTMDGSGISFSSNLSNVTNGSYQVKAYGTDTFGFSNESNEITLLVDTLSPEISSVSLNDSLVARNEPLQISFTAHDQTQLVNATAVFNASQSNQSVITSGTNSTVFVNLTVNATVGTTVGYTITVNDVAGFTTQFSATFQVSNAPPTLTSSVISSTDELNRTNGTLSVSFTAADPDNNPITDNRTRWYNDTEEVLELRNSTTVSLFNTSKNEVWVASVSVFDGTNWSAFVNSSLTIQNTQPTTNMSTFFEVEQTRLMNISLQTTDQDEDTVTLNSNNSQANVSNDQLLFSSSLLDVGIVPVNISINDSQDVVYQLITISLIPTKDSDGDNNPDYNDTDDDNDGTLDNLDFVKGNVSSLNVSNQLGLSLRINGSVNTSIAFNGSIEINITSTILPNTSLVVFNISVNESQTLDLTNITINYTNNGSSGFSLRGLSHQGTLNKHVRLEKVNTTAKAVCIKDNDASLDQITSTCTASDETLVTCNNVTSGPYTCSDTGSLYFITGLNHSAVKEQCRDNDGDGYGVGCTLGTDCNDNSASLTTSCSVGSSSGGGGGGGGGGSGGGGGGGGAPTSTGAKISKYFQVLTPGQTYSVGGTKKSLSVTNITFSVTDSYTSATVSITAVDSLTTIDKPVYEYIQVDHGGLSAESVTVEFAVNASFENNYDSIVLYRYQNNQWNVLNTQRIGPFVYQAQSPGLSLFAIVGETEQKKEPALIVEETNEIQEEPEPLVQTPPVLDVEDSPTSNPIWVLIITGLLLASVVWYRYKTKHKKHKHHKSHHQRRRHKH